MLRPTVPRFAYRQVVNNRSYVPLVSKLGIPATERAERIFFTFVSSELVVGAACTVTQRGIRRGSPDKIRLADAGATGTLQPVGKPPWLVI